jgi:hypothetical protein
VTTSLPTLTGPGTAPAPGTLLTTIAVTSEDGPLGLASTATAEAVRPLPGSPRVTGAHLTMAPGADVPAGTRVTAQAEARVTALLPGRVGTVAEVAVTLTAQPSAQVSTADAPVLGTLDLTVATDLPEPEAGQAPGSRPWAALLHERLRADTRFAELIETYDGTIGLRIGGREVHIRCYRGQVLETVPRSIRGADFLVDISGAEFAALMTAESNTFMESAMQRRLSSTGSGYEYLRMTTALIRIIDVCRALTADAGWGHRSAAAGQPTGSETDRADDPAPQAPTQTGATA